jgi:chorismate dehydratase
MRIGVVSYANSLPLAAGLAEHLPGAELVADTPAAVVRALDEGRLDVGLVPVAALAGRPHWKVVPGLGIAGEGAVRSVLLLANCPPAGIRTLFPDPASMTSNTLARLWLAHTAGVSPEPLRPASGSPSIVADRLAAADATVVIGDEALFWKGEAALVVDLGEAWTEWTGLPFVFAVWAGPGAEEAGLQPALIACYEGNAGRLADLARRVHPGDEARAALVESYLRDNIRYRLGAREEQGLQRFFTLARETGFLPEAPKGNLHVHAG